MKKFLKEKWQIIVIAILLIFGMSKCSQSCNREIRYQNAQKELVSLDSAYRADTTVLKAKIREQASELRVLDERVHGLKNLNDAVSAEQARTDEANKRANAAENRESQLKRELNSIKNQ